ncbi:MAG: VCBS repeat-containing protein, partial [Candidatus Latescibacteria bacterium]|nr:VCBS repeat-containing protein [Candidatus Latescibacterota bacterium]
MTASLVSAGSAEHAVRFAEVTAQAGIKFRHVNGATGKRHFIETMGPGCAFLDYDNDGKLDIYLVNGHELEARDRPKASDALYRNKGDGTFADMTQEAGIKDTGYGMGITAGDYDNDGDLDLYIANYGPNALYRNKGNRTFTDVTRRAGVGDDHWGVGCAFLDYDNDGYLDLYVANYVDFSLAHPKETKSFYLPRGQKTVAQVTGYPHPDNFNGVSDVLYHNNKDGRFTDVTRQAGVSNPGGKGMGMACGDYDNDGDLDLYVANDLTPNFLYRNNGDGTFSEVGLMAGVAYNEDGRAESSMGVDFGDYDRDGNLDLLVSNFQEEGAALYHNEGRGLFANESIAAGIGMATRPYVGWGGGFLDYDNDGELDLFIAMGHVLDNVELFDSRTTYAQRNFLFRNNGSGAGSRYTFTEVSARAGAGLAVLKSSRGAAFGDYDDDGDVDI